MRLCYATRVERSPHDPPARGRSPIVSPPTGARNQLPRPFLTPTIAISDMLRLIKANSSKWANEREDVRYFAWQAGYAAFSVSESQLETVREYIRTQAKHHQRTSFRSGYLTLLRKHNIEFDERYVFEEEHIC
jgi:hypothetical protein